MNPVVKTVLKFLTPKDSLGYTDPTLEMTEGIPEQQSYVDNDPLHAPHQEVDVELEHTPDALDDLVAKQLNPTTDDLVAAMKENNAQTNPTKLG